MFVQNFPFLGLGPTPQKKINRYFCFPSILPRSLVEEKRRSALGNTFCVPVVRRLLWSLFLLKNFEGSDSTLDPTNYSASISQKDSSKDCSLPPTPTSPSSSRTSPSWMPQKRVSELPRLKRPSSTSKGLSSSAHSCPRMARCRMWQEGRGGEGSQQRQRLQNKATLPPSSKTVNR